MPWEDSSGWVLGDFFAVHQYATVGEDDGGVSR